MVQLELRSNAFSDCWKCSYSFLLPLKMSRSSSIVGEHIGCVRSFSQGSHAAHENRPLPIDGFSRQTTYEGKKPMINSNSIYPPLCKKLDFDVSAYTPEGDIEYPFEDVEEAGDENKIHGNWSSWGDYILSSVGFIFSLGNIWRFPMLCFNHGGAAFLVSYFVVLIIVGVPTLFMELSLGQFASLGCISVWKVVPLFKGIGIAMLVLMFALLILNNTIIAWTIFYLINSFDFSLPWTTCTNEWNTISCSVWNHINVEKNLENYLKQNGVLLLKGEANYSEYQMDKLDWNDTILISPFNVSSNVMPSDEYFQKVVLMRSSGFDNVGLINWQLVISMLLSSIIAFLSLFKGIKSAGKVSYIITIAPYMILLTLAVRFLTLPGSIDGLIYYFLPNWNALKNISTWSDASIQVFYSLKICTGSITTLSSYNRFHNNVFRDTWLISFIEILTSIFCAVLIFSAVGFMCYELSIPLEEFQFKSGLHLVFVHMPEAIAKLPVAPLYAVLYFAMIVTILLTTAIFTTETIVSAICDEFPKHLRRNHRHVAAFVSLSFYIISVPFCVSAGLYWLMLLNDYLLIWPPVLIAFFECMAISWIYGVDNLLDNIKWMTLKYPPIYILWKVLWKFVCPLLYLVILSLVLFEYQPMKFEDYTYPNWSNFIGWMVSLTVLCFIPVIGIVQICTAKGSLPQRWCDLLCPAFDWGPALAVHRAEYYPLQIPEARRLISPSKKHVPNDKPVLDAAIEQNVSKSTERTAHIPNHYGSAVSTNIPSFERETAI